MTPEEYSKFGERFPENFKRVGLLGRGGFSVVWLGVHRSSKRKVAIKQILTKNSHIKLLRNSFLLEGWRSEIIILKPHRDQ